MSIRVGDDDPGVGGLGDKVFDRRVRGDKGAGPRFGIVDSEG